jgi:hypothetical protein
MNNDESDDERKNDQIDSPINRFLGDGDSPTKLSPRSDELDPLLLELPTE